MLFRSLPTGPWRGALTIPREVGIVRDQDGYRLVQRAARELEALRAGDPVLDLSDEPLSGRSIDLACLEEMAGELEPDISSSLLVGEHLPIDGRELLRSF